MTANDGLLILIQCPQPRCAHMAQQTAQFSRAELKRMLAAGEDVRVFGAICGHHWSFTTSEKEDLRKALAEARL
jgi:hypothetical protein